MVVIGSVIANAFIALSVILAFWSLWWIVKGSLTNVDERSAEQEARERVAQGGTWDDGPQPEPFTDGELAELSAALAPSDPEQAGIETRPRPPEPKRRPWSINR